MTLHTLAILNGFTIVMLVNALMLNEFAVVEGSFIHQCYPQPRKFSDTSFPLRCLICYSMSYTRFDLALDILVSD